MLARRAGDGISPNAAELVVDARGRAAILALGAGGNARARLYAAHAVTDARASAALLPDRAAGTTTASGGAVIAAHLEALGTGALAGGSQV